MALHKSSAVGLTLAVFGAMVWLLSYYFWPSRIFIINDFTDIPSKTLIRLPQTQSAGYWLDNIEYINDQRILGMYRYNPNTRQIPPQSAVAGISIDDARNVSQLVKDHLGVYNSEFKQLVVNPSDNKSWAQLLTLFANSADQHRLRAYYQQWTRGQVEQKTATIPAELQVFSHHNAYEWWAGSRIWHFFHHHDAMFGPISAYHLGKANSDNNFFYGWGLNLGLYKLMQWTGEFNFQHYLTVINAFYPLYYLAWIGVVYYLSRNVWLTLLGTMLACACVYLTGFEEMRFMPGVNPVRHGLDLPLLVLLSLFFTKRALSRYLYLAVAVVLAPLAILLNFEFGLSLAVALIATLVLSMVCERRQRWLTAAFVMVAMALSGLALMMLPKTPYSLLKYLLLGVATPAANFTVIYVIGAFSSLVYLFLLFDRKNPLSTKLLIVWLSAYFLACSTYYVIYAAAAHVRPLLPIAILAVILILHGIRTYIQASVEVKNFWLALFIPTTVLYMTAQLAYVNVWQEFLEVRKTHQAYFWSFPRAQFWTDMDPKPFANALDLIQHYADQPSMLLISKYDSILYWLSDHYSALPYGTLAIGIPSQRERQVLLDKIRRSDSCVLFVDADIASSHFGDVRVDNPRLFGTGKNFHFRDFDMVSLRAYYTLSDLFFAVKANYHLQQRGDLIDVYRANRCQE